MTKTTKLIVWVVSGVVVASFGYRTVSRAGDEVATILPGQIKRSIVTRAAVVPVDGISKIRTRLDGSVLRVHVREGDHVRKGQRLAELEAVEVSRRVERVHAEAAALEAVLESALHGGNPQARREWSALRTVADRELTVARRNALRANALSESGSMTEVAAEEATATAEIAQARLAATQARLDATGRAGPFEVRAARHRLEAARAEFKAMEAELSRAQLLAPADGMVLSRRVNPGDVVRVLDGNVLFELADPLHIELRAEVEELQAPLVRVGAPVQVTAPGGMLPLAKGRVVRVAPGVGNRLIAGDPSELRADSLVRAVYIALDSNAELRLPIGQRVEVRIGLATEAVAAQVPRAAVMLENGNASVTIQSGLVRQQRAVRLGVADEENVQIHGLPLGTRVVLAPAARPF